MCFFLFTKIVGATRAARPCAWSTARALWTSKAKQNRHNKNMTTVLIIIASKSNQTTNKSYNKIIIVLQHKNNNKQNKHIKKHK